MLGEIFNTWYNSIACFLNKIDTSNSVYHILQEKKNPHFKILQFVQANKIVFYYNSTLVKKQNWEEEAAEEKSEN